MMSMAMMSLLLPAFVACLVLLGIHVYLGLHVISRGVIFVDLALAQVAALGATTALLFGAEPGSTATYAASLAFCFFGAVLFTLARSQSRRVPVEAFIGIVYAVSSAVAVIVADRLPHGADEIHEILVGSLLSVTWTNVAWAAAVYTVIGLVHLVFREQFFAITHDPDAAKARGINIALWDLLFYLTFGVVISISVAIGGVLIVFSFLVIPTVVAALFYKDTVPRLLVGWAVGLAGCILGIMASVEGDLPTGAAVVATFGALLVVALGVRAVLPGSVEVPVRSSH
jgi:zinc/manganese transport system permease protein